MHTYTCTHAHAHAHAHALTLSPRHRLACFRDDIVFFIYLYQCYVYRVDPSRRNEYGQLAEDEEERKRIERGEGRNCRRQKYELREVLT
jgi:hypothetical protein